MLYTNQVEWKIILREEQIIDSSFHSYLLFANKKVYISLKQEEIVMEY